MLGPLVAIVFVSVELAVCAMALWRPVETMKRVARILGGKRGEAIMPADPVRTRELALLGAIVALVQFTIVVWAVAPQVAAWLGR
jgi:hypothetical protein